MGLKTKTEVKESDKNILKVVDKYKLSAPELTRILQSVENSSPRQLQTFEDYFEEKTRIGVFSDSHIGAREFDEPFFKHMCKTFDTERVSRIYQAGDILEGMSGRDGQIYELSDIGFQKQMEHAIKCFKRLPVTCYGIDGNHDCLSIDTEVLTDTGWKLFNQVSMQDKILSLNPAGRCYWDKIQEIIIKEPDDIMVNIETKQTSMLITKKHRVLCTHRGFLGFKGQEYILADNLSGRIKIPTSGSLITGGLNWAQDRLKLMAWILTDGQCKNGHCKIYQSKDISGIVQILKNLNVDFKISTRNREIVEICGKKLKRRPLPQHEIRFCYNLPDKYPFPKALFLMSDEEFEVFFSELIKGDGSFYARGCFILYGIKTLLDEIQALCHMHNFRATLSYDNRGHPRLNICRRNSTEFDCYKSKKEKEYHDLIWCLRVPETNFLVRRNGKCFFTGNSWFEKKNNAGVVVGKELEKMVKNYHHLGQSEANVALRKNITMKLIHPGDGTAYAISYKPQKRMEAFTGGEKPEIMLEGHYHKALYMFYRNIHSLDCATLCFLPQTTIFTSEGHKPICKIKEGDLVFTHLNRLRHVKKVLKHKSSEKLIKLQFGRRNQFETISATENHPILIERNGKKEWMAINRVRVGDLVFILSNICKHCGNKIPYYNVFCKDCNPMNRDEVRQKLSETRGSFTRKYNQKGSGWKHLKEDIIPFCEALDEKGIIAVPVGAGVIPDIISFNGKEIIAYELEKKRGLALARKKKKYENSPILEWIDKVEWIDINKIKMNKNQNFYKEDGAFIKVPVIGISEKQLKNRTVYNLEVEEDNTYIARRVVVHNCGQTNWMRGKNISAHKGFWIVDIEMGKGGIGSFKPTFYPGYK